MLNKRNSRIVGGTLLIAGTTIGAAVLAMPIMTGLFGFIGTLAVMISCWLFMYWTATLILEATLRFKPGVSFSTMAQKTLGRSGSAITWIIFLLLFYSLIAAYLSGSGQILMDSIEGYLAFDFPKWLTIIPLLVLLTPFIFFGLSIVDHLNRILMVGMLLSYIGITFWLLPGVNAEKLLYSNWAFSLLSFSVVVTSFGYHVIIPTLVSYLERDVSAIKRCMFLGSLIPLLGYAFWELVILGNIPVFGIGGLAQAFQNDMPLAALLRLHRGDDFITILSKAFSVFAIVTSFLGVSQGLFDFLRDAIDAGGSSSKRMMAFLLTFAPPIGFLLFFEKGFIALLEYAGALVAIVLGIVPILIVWRLRSDDQKIISYRARGGRVALLGGILFFSFVVLLVVLKNIGFLTFELS